jgi:addiction module RelE/StbE family toxin
MRRINYSSDAKRDIASIWVYIAADSFDAADRVEDEIESEVQKLADQPGMGHRRPDLRNPDYRAWSVYSYLIIYRYDEHTLTVVRVIHGARDIGSIIR